MQINIPTEKFSEAGSSVLKRLKMKKRNRNILIIAIAVVLLTGISLAIYLKWPKEIAEILPVVQAEPVRIENVGIYVEYAGKIKAKQHVEIRARVEGYLEKMHFEEGGYVKKNDLLS